MLKCIFNLKILFRCKHGGTYQSLPLLLANLTSTFDQPTYHLIDKTMCSSGDIHICYPKLRALFAFYNERTKLIKVRERDGGNVLPDKVLLRLII
jgi:hypothetical protein